MFYTHSKVETTHGLKCDHYKKWQPSDGENLHLLKGC